MDLKVIIPSVELYDEVKKEFITTKEYRLTLKHSLVSIAKWESKWKKAFLGKDEKTTEETMDYIKCMTITQNIPNKAYRYLTKEVIFKVNEYIKDAMTATTFRPKKGGGTKEVITSEVIYYWMVAHSIPFECQKWHINRLLTLIEVCNIKNQPPEKRSRGEIMRRNRSLNEARKKKLNTKG